VNILKRFFLFIWFLFSGRRHKKSAYPYFKRHSRNPILGPINSHDWESEGVFNAAAVEIDGNIHLIYRAIGRDGISKFGYARTRDGYTIIERSKTPAYWPRMPFEGTRSEVSGFNPMFGSGGGCGGCEDPKLTFMDNKVYLTYVAHSGYWPPRTAISWINKSDFLNKNWLNWSKPALMSPPNIDSKSACLLPEKVNGKYVIYHRTWPNIYVDYVDDLDFNSDNKWLSSQYSIPVRSDFFDSQKLSMGAPPVKTKDGWLAVYGTVDWNDSSRYKVGAMLLDFDEPHKVNYRTSKPILAPDEPYENDWKPGIVYPSGLIIRDKKVFIYYGGGDKHVCLVTSPLDKFLEDLKAEKQIMVDSRK
jgi:beta-1,2-mannobiose phosphorylase / 1,2-beta-oligomannan phosphorylase